MLSPTHDRQPLSEMPIWARLAFAEMIPKTHFGNENMTDPRHVAETEVIGFIRIEYTIWLYFVLDLSLIHISEPTRLGMISYAVFCLKKKKNQQKQNKHNQI